MLAASSRSCCCGPPAEKGRALRYPSLAKPGGPSSSTPAMPTAPRLRRLLGASNNAGTPADRLLAGMRGQLGAVGATNPPKNGHRHDYRFFGAGDRADITAENGRPHIGCASPPDRWSRCMDRFIPQTDTATFCPALHRPETNSEAGTIFGAGRTTAIIRTPFDDWGLIMPARRLTPGKTAVPRPSVMADIHRPADA